MTQHGHESHANVNHMGTQKNPLPSHTTSNCIKTQNENPTVLNTNPKNEHDCHADCQPLIRTASHFQAIITQNANENMPMMVLIA